MSRGEKAKQDILDAAERLIAEHGIQVPLRDIAVAAGQRNNSAVNYYFRNRQDLIDAVVKRRLGPMEVQRRRMLDAAVAGECVSVEGLLRVMVVPFFSVESLYYARFLQAVALHLRTDPDQTHGSVWPQIVDQLSRAVPTTDRRARRRRVGAVATAMFALLAEHEQRAHVDPATAATADEIIAMLSAMLTTPLPPAGRTPESCATRPHAGTA